MLIIRPPYRTIALLGREPGILVLQNALLNNPLINLIAVYTHGLLPKKEGGLPRPELSRYIDICASSGVPLQVLDFPEARQLESHLPSESFDLLIVLSWRCILSKVVLDKPKIAAINMHRGKIPEYKGAEPVLKAINAGEKSIFITAHHMTEELDEGLTIATISQKIKSCPENMDSTDYAEQIKRDLYPLYAPLLCSSIERIVNSNNEKEAMFAKSHIPKAVFLDLDGTIADSLSVMRTVYQLFLKQFHRKPTEYEFDSINGPPLVEVIRYLKASHDLEGDEDVLLANYSQLIDQVYIDVKPFIGAKKFLQKAKEHACIVGIVTSNTQKRTQAWLEKNCLSHIVNFIISGDQVTHGKPHPEPYITAMKKTSFNPDEIVVIEDSKQGVKSAIDAGLKTFALNAETADSSFKGVTLISSFIEATELLFNV